jgi:hypothetical protein
MLRHVRGPAGSGRLAPPRASGRTPSMMTTLDRARSDVILNPQRHDPNAHTEGCVWARARRLPIPAPPISSRISDEGRASFGARQPGDTQRSPVSVNWCMPAMHINLRNRRATRRSLMSLPLALEHGSSTGEQQRYGISCESSMAAAREVVQAACRSPRAKEADAPARTRVQRRFQGMPSHLRNLTARRPRSVCLYVDNRVAERGATSDANCAFRGSYMCCLSTCVT